MTYSKKLCCPKYCARKKLSTQLGSGLTIAIEDKITIVSACSCTNAYFSIEPSFAISTSPISGQQSFQFLKICIRYFLAFRVIKPCACHAFHGRLFEIEFIALKNSNQTVSLSTISFPLPSLVSSLKWALSITPRSERHPYRLSVYHSSPKGNCTTHFSLWPS